MNKVDIAAVTNKGNVFLPRRLFFELEQVKPIKSASLIKNMQKFKTLFDNNYCHTFHLKRLERVGIERKGE